MNPKPEVTEVSTHEMTAWMLFNAKTDPEYNAAMQKTLEELESKPDELASVFWCYGAIYVLNHLADLDQVEALRNRPPTS